MIGVLTGISSTTIGIGEKAWYPKDWEFKSIFGQPWMFILRDALSAPNEAAALKIIEDAHRTCAIHIALGSSVDNIFHGLTVSSNQYNVYNWTSLEWPAHPIIKDVMYWDKNYQPSHNSCLADLLQYYHGKLDAETVALKIAPVSGTGNDHAVVFDYENEIAYVSFASKTGTKGDINAYNRQFTVLNLTNLYD
jgi:hypothetical protein